MGGASSTPPRTPGPPRHRGDRPASRSHQPRLTLALTRGRCHGGIVFRLLGLLGGLSIAMDQGSGAPLEESLKRGVVGVRLARAMGCPDETVRDVAYVSLLQHVGCTAFSYELARSFGDDIAAIRLSFLTDFDRPDEILRTFVPGLARATGRSRVRALAATVASTRASRGGPPATCEVARDAARRLGLPASVQNGLYHLTARWDGKGFPAVAGEAVPLCARIMHVASTGVTFRLHTGDVAAALARVRQVSGSYLDPDIAGVLSAAHLVDLDDLDAQAALLELEPDPVQLVDDSALEVVARTFGNLVDLKSPWLQGHSAAVAGLAGRAGDVIGLPDTSRLQVAGHLHDVGRFGVSSRIWSKAGPLTTTEREQARLHPYYTERILMRVPALVNVASIASQHHERLDGTGYHRRVNGLQLSLPARVLAAADAYESWLEDRPHRKGLPAGEAASTLRQEARAGRLDAEAVAAVLEAAGQPVGGSRPSVAGLTPRQVDVLRLVARGSTNREIADRLGISARTAEHHVQDIYTRIGVSTRAAAALFAMEHGLLDGSRGVVTGRDGASR